MSEARQEQQIWTDPGAASLYAVAIICLCLSVFWMGWVKPEAAPLLIPPMVAAGITPLICGIIDMRRGMVLSGTLGLVFGGILGFGGVSQVAVMTWTAVQGIPLDPTITGYMWGGAGVILILIGIVALRASWWFFAALVMVGIGLVLNALAWIVPALMPLSGWILFVFSLWCFYTATAIIMNTMARKPVLPLGGPVIKD